MVAQVTFPVNVTLRAGRVNHSLDSLARRLRAIERRANRIRLGNIVPRRAIRDMDALNARLNQTRNNTRRLNTDVRTLNTLLSTSLGFFAIRALNSLNDQYISLQNRLKLVTEGSENLHDIQTRLFDIANRTRVSYEAVSTVFTRTALAAKALGFAQEDILRFTEAVQQAAVVSGASVRETTQSLIQLSQGIASNRLSGDELRSVLEGIPRVADLIAEGIGATRGQLRAIAREGGLTAQVVIEAILSQSRIASAEFQKTVPTISQSVQVLKNAFQEFIGLTDEATGVSRTFSAAILALANNIDTVAFALGVFLTGLAAAGIVRGIKVIIGFVTDLLTGFRKLIDFVKNTPLLQGILGTIARIAGSVITIAVVGGAAALSQANQDPNQVTGANRNAETLNDINRGILPFRRFPDNVPIPNRILPQLTTLQREYAELSIELPPPGVDPAYRREVRAGLRSIAERYNEIVEFEVQNVLDSPRERRRRQDFLNNLAYGTPLTRQRPEDVERTGPFFYDTLDHPGRTITQSVIDQGERINQEIREQERRLDLLRAFVPTSGATATGFARDQNRPSPGSVANDNLATLERLARNRAFAGFDTEDHPGRLITQSIIDASRESTEQLRRTAQETERRLEIIRRFVPTSGPTGTGFAPDQHRTLPGSVPNDRAGELARLARNRAFRDFDTEDHPGRLIPQSDIEGTTQAIRDLRREWMEFDAQIDRVSNLIASNFVTSLKQVATALLDSEQAGISAGRAIRNFFIETLAGIAQQNIQTQVSGFISGVLSAGLSAFAFGGAGGGQPATLGSVTAATGFEGIVRGRSGRDTNPFLFHLSNGEDVRVRTAAQRQRDENRSSSPQNIIIVNEQDLRGNLAVLNSQAGTRIINNRIANQDRFIQRGLVS